MDWLLTHLRALQEAHFRTFGRENESLNKALIAAHCGCTDHCRNVVDKLYSQYACADADNLRLAAYDILTHIPRAA